MCARTGLSPRTVRYYEELGLLPGVRRRSGARRVYGEDELERLRFIQRLKALGLTLHEIKDLNSLYALAGSTRAMLERLADLLDSHVDGLDARIAELLDLRAEMTRYRGRVASRIELLAERPSGVASRTATGTPSSGDAAATEGAAARTPVDPGPSDSGKSSSEGTPR